MQISDEKGSALITVLLIAMVILIMSGAIISAVAWHHRTARRDLHRTQAYYKAEAGIYKALWYLSGHEGRDIAWRPTREEVSVNQEQVATVTVRERGGFLEVESLATVKKQSETLFVTVGQNLSDTFDQAIVLGGVDLPLVVTGNTRITGDITVGKSGVKAGNLKGVKYSGERLVWGKIHRQSPLEMPPFDPAIFQSSLNRAHPPGSGLDVRDDSLATGSETDDELVIVPVAGDQFRLSELDSALLRGRLLLSTAGDISISDTARVPGRVDIRAQGWVVISGDLRFNDLVVYSHQSIHIDGNVRGSLQLITTADITLSGQVRLEYPSVLYTSGHVAENKFVGSIRVLDNARVTGTIILYEPAAGGLADVRRETTVEVGRAALVTGIIFSTNRLSITGEMNGTVITDHFYLYDAPTTYINWLKDATINRSRLPDGFRLPLLFTETPSLEIIKWN